MAFLRRLRLTRPGALPFAAYRDPEIHARELEAMFRGDWVAVCSAASLAAPGAFYALEIGGEPVAVVRDAEGRLRALSNACRHRGTQLLDDGMGEISSIVCPYHAWAYGLDGAFRGAPMTGEVEIDREHHALPEFALEVWAGVIFVNVAGNARPLGERMRSVDAHLSAYHLDRYDWSPGPGAPERWEANWKLAFENAIESYHLFKVHQKTLERVSPTRGAYYVEGGAEWAVTAGALEADRTPYPGEPAGMTEADRARYVLVSLPPSFVGILTRDSWGWITIHPDGPERCRITGEALIPEAYASAAGDGSIDDFTAAFMAEDKWICERGQRGIQSRHSSGGQLVELERVVGDFHHYVAARLFGRTPEAPWKNPDAP